MARSAGGGVRFTVSGVKEIQRAYRLLPKQVANKVVRQSMRTALKPMLAEAKKDAPKGETGLLSRSIKLRARAKRKRGIIALDVRVGDGDFKGATYYAAFLEHGTEHIDAVHYMETAFTATKDGAAKTVVQLIGAGIAREWKNL